MADITLTLDYAPQPKQRMLGECPANEILFGGSAGPGKSYSIRHEALLWAQKIPKLQVYLFRRTYPELEKNHILPILMEWGEKFGKYNEQKRRYALPNGSCIHMCHAQHDKDVMLYHGAEIHMLVIDELSTFSEWQYTYLRNRLRCTLEIPTSLKHKIPGIMCGSNPGGPGHEFCKRMFVDFCLLDTDPALKRMQSPEKYGPVYEHPSKRLGYTIHYGLKKATDKDGGMLRAYIPALLEDNPILLKRDPGYRNRVMAMPEPYRSAYLDGDWEIFIGQMFSFSRQNHVCAPHPIPKNAPIYFTFDWGFGAPFSCGWSYVDSDGRIFRFSEWYGWTGQPNKGLRLSESELSEGILKHEMEIGLRTRSGGIAVDGFDCGRPTVKVAYILSPDCFSKKPDVRGGGQGPSTAEVFSRYGIHSIPGDPSRALKIRQYHERLRVKENERPMFMVFDNCVQYIRTIPLLQQDIHNPEDVCTTLEDHIYDESALLFMARPLSLEIPRESQSSYDRRIDELIKGTPDDYEQYAAADGQMEISRLEGDEWDHLAGGDYDDGGRDGLVSTVE